MRRVYLDHHSTTPLDPRVLEAMIPFLTEKFGNASSRTHAFGREAEEGVECARAQVASLLGAQPRDIVFTSGATESDNLALQGVASFYRDRGNHIITSRIEHRAVLDTCRALEKQGFEVTSLPVDSCGSVDPEAVSRALTARTILISIIYASHEIGTVQEIQAIGKIAKEREIFFHCDATQGAGKEPIDVDALGVDLLSLSAHKIYGPKGIGALYVRRRKPRVRLEPLVHGGGQERNFRSGTLNVPAIAGFGKACELAGAEMDEERSRLVRLRALLHQRLSRLEGVGLNGHPERRLAGNLNLSFADVEARALLRALGNEIALSPGAACTSAVPEPSYVLRAIGLPLELTLSSVRFGLGRFNTEEEVRWAADRVAETVEELRSRPF
ncbi:MAG: cysteine desulfurase family protein [Acidobacteriota bacterium]